MDEKQYLLNLISGWKTLPEPAQKQNWERVYNQMVVHTRKVVPADLLLSRRPNEEEAVYNYRIENYEPITFGLTTEIIDFIQLFLSSVENTIEMSDDLREYIKQRIFDNDNFLGWASSRIVKYICDDPNGLILYEVSGEGLKDDSKKVDVKPVYYPCSAIRFIDPGVCVILTISEDAEKINGEYLVVTQNKYWKIIVKTDNGDQKITLEEIYTHELKELPLVILKGNWVDGYYDSYLSPLIPFANEAIRQFSDWQGVMITAGFPYREELSVDCVHCVNGKVEDEKTGELSTCPVCKGQTKVVPRSPYGTYIRPVPTGFDDDRATSALSIPSLRFIGPDVELVKYNGEAWKSLLNDAKEQLHIRFIQESQSGIAKEFDRQGLQSFLTKFCNNFFDNFLYSSLWIMERLRSPYSPSEVVITKPAEYKVRTENDIAEDINRMIEKKSPASFIIAAMRELIKKRFSNDPYELRKMLAVLNFDPLMPYPVEEKRLMLAQNIITREQFVASVYAYKIVSDVADELWERGSYYKTPVEEIAKLAAQKMASFIAENPTVSLIDFSKTDEA